MMIWVLAPMVGWRSNTFAGAPAPSALQWKTDVAVTNARLFGPVHFQKTMGESTSCDFSFDLVSRLNIWIIFPERRARMLEPGFITAASALPCRTPAPMAETAQLLMRVAAMSQPAEVRKWAAKAADSELTTLVKGVREVHQSWLHADAALINMNVELALLKQGQRAEQARAAWDPVCGAPAAGSHQWDPTAAHARPARRAGTRRVGPQLWDPT